MFTFKKRLLVAASAATALVTASLSVPAVASAADCATTVLNVVAHQDDDLLFMSPDLIDDVTGGACVVTVFLTAGDAGGSAEYWQARERGSQAAYSQMLGQPTDATWPTDSASFAGRTVRIATSPEGTVTGIYLRLPDGGIGGDGHASTGGGSLTKLWNGSISTASTIDGSATYTRDGLVATLSAIVSWAGPSRVHVQDARPDQSDHADHSVGGNFALAALHGFDGEVAAYRGYGAVSEPANVSGGALQRKIDALLAYAPYDPLLCSTNECPSGVEAEWTSRQYTAPLVTSLQGVPGPAAYDGPNVARNALVSVSSESAGQGAVRAIDAVLGGYPGNGSAEWASAGERAGAWLLLTWSSPQTVDRVRLFDRPNGADQVTGGVLTFSDGSTVEVPALDNWGEATEVAFSPRSTTSLRFTVTSVGDWTSNIGLSEIEVFGGTPTPTGATAATPPTTFSPSPPPTLAPAQSIPLTPAQLAPTTPSPGPVQPTPTPVQPTPTAEGSTVAAPPGDESAQ